MPTPELPSQLGSKDAVVINEGDRDAAKTASRWESLKTFHRAPCLRASVGMGVLGGIGALAWASLSGDVAQREAAAMHAVSEMEVAVSELAPLHEAITSLGSEVLLPMRTLELDAAQTASRYAESLAEANARAISEQSAMGWTNEIDIRPYTEGWTC